MRVSGTFQVALSLVLVIARNQEDKMTTYPVQLKKLILGKVKLGKSDHGLDSVE